jgi:hypothetical protein
MHIYTLSYAYPNTNQGVKMRPSKTTVDSHDQRTMRIAPTITLSSINSCVPTVVSTKQSVRIGFSSHHNQPKC